MSQSTERLTTALAGRYRVERLLGQGGMASVYLAEDLKHERKVALKVLKPELAAVLGADRFVVEIKTTAALQHPHILPLFDSGEADGFLFYAMPFIDGETLRDRLNRETQLGVDEAVRLAREVLDALHYAHSRGVVHRDIKPENILLQGGRALVADFGIALAVSAAAGGRMTETGLSLGTPHYMSPEQATAEKEITGRSDQYSLASVLYELLTGEPPHMGNSAQQIIMKIITEPAQPVTRLRKTVPPHVAAAVAKALEKLPADRFESAQAFSEALGNSGFTTAMPGMTGGAGAPVRRGRSLAALAGVAIAGALVGALVITGLRDAPPTAEVVRFTLELPNGRTLRRELDTDSPWALSPDGRQVAFVAADTGTDVVRLWIRSLDQLESREIPTPVRPAAPFFSPDGQWIGYFEEDASGMYKAPVAGGPSIRLVNDADRIGAVGSWSEDGWIYYTSIDGRLSRVAATGGDATRLTAEDSTRWIGVPYAIPGGRYVLVSSCFVSSNCTRGDVEVLDVTRGETRVLVPGAYRSWYLGGGTMIYAAEDGSIFAVPFDERKATIAGAASPLFGGVAGPFPGTTRLTVTPSGAMMYQPRISGGGEVELVEVDREGDPTGRIELRGGFRTPRYSPALERVALSRTDASTSTIWIYDVGSRTLASLMQGVEGTRPAWSPDGRQIAFLRLGSAQAGIQLVSANGGTEPVAISGRETGGSPSYSRDGRWLVYDGAYGGAGRGEDIFAVSTSNFDSVAPVVSSPANEEAGVVSPDGRWIAYVANESSTSQVFVRPFRRDGGRWLLSPGGAVAPLWTSDNELVYLDSRANEMVAVHLEFAPDPRVVSRESLFDARNFVPSERSTAQYDVSRDGQRFLMLRGQDLNLWPSPVIVLNWREEVKRLVAAPGDVPR